MCLTTPHFDSRLPVYLQGQRLGTVNIGYRDSIDMEASCLLRQVRSSLYVSLARDTSLWTSIRDAAGSA